MNRLVSSLARTTVFASLAVACSAPTSMAPPPETAPAPPAVAPRACPLGVDGAHVATTDVAGGIDLLFTIEGPVDALRERVRDVAAMYGPGAHHGLGHHGRHGGGEAHGLGLASLPPLRAESIDLPDGARLRLAPLDAASVELVRAAVRQRVAYIAQPPCL